MQEPLNSDQQAGGKRRGTAESAPLPHAAGGSLVTLVDAGTGHSCHGLRSVREDLQGWGQA